jgi:hypothetical protein
MRRFHGLRGVFRQHIHVLVEAFDVNARAASCRAPCGLIRKTRRNHGPRQIKIKTSAC